MIGLGESERTQSLVHLQNNGWQTQAGEPNEEANPGYTSTYRKEVMSMK
jgi:hypothetical protein